MMKASRIAPIFAALLGCQTTLAGDGLAWQSLHQEVVVSGIDRYAAVRFVCKNEGARPIGFEEVHRSCGCIDVVVEPSVVPPGGNATVTATIDVASQVGAKSLELSVNTDDERVHELSAQVIAPALGYFWPSTHRWDVGADRRPQTIRFVPLGEREVLLDHIDFDGGTISARVIGASICRGFEIEVYPLSTTTAREARLFVFARAGAESPPKKHTAILTIGRGSESMAADSVSPCSGFAATAPTLGLSKRSEQASSASDSPHWTVLLFVSLGIPAVFFLVRWHLPGQPFLALIVPAGLLLAFGIGLRWPQRPERENDLVALWPQSGPTLRAEPQTVAGLSPVACSAKLPTLVVEERAFDFREAAPTGFLEHRFVLKNSGDSELSITRIAASSGQLTARMAHLRIPCGEEAAVDVRLTLAGQRGPQNHSVYIETNDPRLPELSLRLFGTVTPRAKPGRANQFSGMNAVSQSL